MFMPWDLHTHHRTYFSFLPNPSGQTSFRPNLSPSLDDEQQIYSAHIKMRITLQNALHTYFLEIWLKTNVMFLLTLTFSYDNHSSWKTGPHNSVSYCSMKDVQENMALGWVMITFYKSTLHIQPRQSCVSTGPVGTCGSEGIAPFIL